MPEQIQLPVVLLASACLYFVLVLCKSYKDTGSQMSIGDFAVANKGPLLGLVVCTVGIVWVTGTKNGTSVSFGSQPDVIMHTDFYQQAEIDVPEIV